MLYYPVQLTRVIPGDNSSNWKATCDLFPKTLGVHQDPDLAAEQVRVQMVEQMERAAKNWKRIPEPARDRLPVKGERWVNVGVEAGVRVIILNKLLDLGVSLMTLVKDKKLHSSELSELLDFKNTRAISKVGALLEHVDLRAHGIELLPLWPNKAS